MVELVEEVRSEPREVSRIRHALAEALSLWGVVGENCDVAVLLTSELVTNAIRYGGPPVLLRVVLGDLALTVAVADGTPDDVHAVTDVRWDAVGGRGLQLVESLADRWGVVEQAVGKKVWFELRLGT